MRNNEPVLDVKKVRHAMVEKGYNQAGLARAIGVHQSRVSLWLQERNNPDLPSAVALAKSLGVTVDSLLLVN